MQTRADDEEQQPRRAGTPALAVVVGLTLVVRVLVTLSRLDELELERYAGNLGWALIHGVRLDPETLPIIPHLRGSVLFGALSAPILWLLGPTLTAVKVLAVAWSCLAAALCAVVAGRAGGPRAALGVGVFLALGPPAFQMVDVLALGSHADTIPFLAASLALVLGPGVGRAGTSRGTYLALGLMVGASLLFSMQLWVATPALLAAWFVRDRRFVLRSGAALCALAAIPSVALIPVLTRSTDLPREPLAEGGLLRIPEKFAEALFSEFPRTWLYHTNGQAWAMWVLGVVLAVGALLVLARLPWRRLLRGSAWTPAEALGLFALLHVAALFGAYSISDFRVNLRAVEDGMGSRYFMPLMLAMGWFAVTVVVGLHARSPKLGRVLVAALLAVGAAGVGPLLDPAVGLAQPPVAATEYYAFGRHLQHATPADFEARLALLDELEPDWGDLRALAHRGTFVRRERYDRAQLAAELRDVANGAPSLQPFRFAGLGTQIAEQSYDRLAMSTLGGRPQSEHGELLLEEFSEIVETVLDALDEPGRTWFLRGFGRQLTGVQAAGIMPAINGSAGSAELGGRIGFRLLEALPGQAREPLTMGMGFQFGLRLTRYERVPRAILAELAILPAAGQRLWLRAAGQGFRMRFRESDFDPEAPLSIREEFDAEQWAWFQRGLAADAERPPAPR